MAYAGKNSAVEIGADVVAELNDASISINGELIDVTVFGAGQWRQKIASFVDATINISGFYNAGDATGQAVMRNAVLAGTKVQDITVLADTTVATSGFTTDAFVTTFDMSTTVEGAVAVSITLESDGAIVVSS